VLFLFLTFFLCFCFILSLLIKVRGGEGGDTLTVESDESKLDKIQALLAFDGGSGNSNDIDHFIMINNADVLNDDVLNLTRFVVETASMGFDNSSWAPESSYWINLRDATEGTFTLEVFDPVMSYTETRIIAYPINETALESIIQRMIIPKEEELDTCGEIGTSKCTNAVKVWSVGDDAFAVFFVGERIYDGVLLNMTEKKLDNFVPEFFQNITNDILQQNSDVVYTNVETLGIFMGDLDVVINVRGKFLLGQLNAGKPGKWTYARALLPGLNCFRKLTILACFLFQ
jgi:hypothetical protein